MNWRNFDHKTLELEYSPSSIIGGNYQPFIDAYVHESARAFAKVPCRRDLRYGLSPRAWLDFFPAAGQDSELLVFIHGGYWQELSKNESAFLAQAWVSSGRAHCVLDYDLAPHASLEAIVQQCIVGLKWLIAHASALGFNAQKVVIAGSSAGAHLAAMLGLAMPNELRGMVLLSGIYDLEPLVQTYVNKALGLDVVRARALSPLHLFGRANFPFSKDSAALGDEVTRKALPFLDGKGAAKRFPKCLVAYGQHETLEFKRQSQEFAALLLKSGVTCASLEVAERNHFDLAISLGDAQSELFARATHCFTD